jgi:hypothetical protein
MHDMNWNGKPEKRTGIFDEILREVRQILECFRIAFEIMRILQAGIV